jgi:hypothetical protein
MVPMGLVNSMAVMSLLSKSIYCQAIVLSFLFISRTEQILELSVNLVDG